MSTTTAPSAVVTRPPAVLRPPHRVAVGLGALAAMIGLAFSWVPSLWYDEAATVVSATRTWPALWQMVQHVDAVHAAYYAGMHLWFDLVGYTPVTLRLPSAVAGGFGVALTVHLVDTIASRRVAILAGVVLTVIPRYTWAMTEGRSYALSSTLAVLATLLLVTAIRGSDRLPGRRTLILWAAYTAACVAAITCFAYLALLLVAHALTVLVLAHRHDISIPMLRRFSAALATTAVLTLPLILTIAGQSGQVAWIRPLGWHTIGSVLTTQYSPDNSGFACLALLLLGTAALLRVIRRTPRSRRTDPHGTSAMTVVGPVLVVPLGALIAASCISPLYSPRYLTFTTFAFAAVIAFALDTIMQSTPAVVSMLLAILIAASAPSYVGQREPEAKQASSWAAVAALVASYAPEERDDTAIVYDRVAGHPTTTARIIADSYPTSFAPLRDVGLTAPYTTAATLWGSHDAVRPDELHGMDASWLIASRRSPPTAAIRAITSAGMMPTRTWHLSDVDITYFTRADG